MATSNVSGLTDKEEVELLYALKQLPDFDCLPLPACWFEKYKLEPRKAVGPKEYIEANHAMKMAVAQKDLPPIIIDEPQQGGKLVPLAPFESVPIEVRSRPFILPEGKSFPAVIAPTYEELGIPETQHRMSLPSGDLSRLTSQNGTTEQQVLPQSRTSIHEETDGCLPSSPAAQGT